MQDPPQHGAASNSAPSYDSSSVSSAASPRAQFPSNSPYYHSAPPTRPGSGLNPGPSIAPPPAPFTHRYDSTHRMAVEPPAHLSETQYLPGQGLMQSQLASVPIHNQKRAYRQRRKDPSCDACRERKVKCDATDTTSCSECSSRNVRCQFTKETNRRMSSIKQVQDLEKQLQAARQQLHHYRSLIPRTDGEMDLDEPAHSQHELPKVGVQPERRMKPPITEDLSRVRANMRDYGRGVLSVPPPYRIEKVQDGHPQELPILPPRHLADTLIERYYECVHNVFPVIHWPTFHESYTRVYHQGNVKEVPRDWMALLYSIFACGSMYTANSERFSRGKEFMVKAHSMLDIWQDVFSIDRIRTAFLTSLFSWEGNVKSASWVWLGASVRMAQDIGLHVQSGPWSTIDGEMRKRVWYCLYTWDRVLSLELGKPMLITEDDFDTEYPEPVDDCSITHDGIVDSHQPSTTLLCTIHLARSLQPLSKLFRGPYITTDTLHSREQYLNVCISSFPKYLFFTSRDSLDARSLPPMLYYQNARFLLFRHNLSPSAPAEMRLHAIENCTRVALDTTQLISRCMASHESSREGWRHQFVSSASTMLCLHLWRCMLILLFSGEYNDAIVLVRASSAIGDSRTVNTFCGRYVSFFLSALYDRLQNGAKSFDRDEEMIAYVSADVQASADGSWIWQGSETGHRLKDLMREQSSSRLVNEKSKLPSDAGFSAGVDPTASLSLEEASSWGGWERIERSLHHLLDCQQKQPSPQPSPIVDHNEHSRPSLPPIQFRPSDGAMGPSKASPDIPRINTSDLLRPPGLQQQRPTLIASASSTNSPGYSRMNIANII